VKIETAVEELVPGELVLVRTNDLKDLAELGQKYSFKSTTLIASEGEAVYKYNLLCCVEFREADVVKGPGSLSKITLEQLRELVACELLISPDELTEDTDLYDTGMDSLDLVELIIVLEDELEIEISDRTIDKLQTFGDIVALVDSQDLLAKE